jgi:hypothetical protein
MIELVEIAKFYTSAEWYILFFVIALTFISAKIFGLNYINAILIAQFWTVFNTVPIISGSFSGLVPNYLIIQFFFCEAIFLLSVMYVYSIILNKSKIHLSEITDFFDGKILYLLISFSFIAALLNYTFTPQDGTSRILYQTNYWYSFVKPFYQVSTPISFFAVFILIFTNRRRKSAYLLLTLNILASIASGSKGAFVMQALTGILMVRDLNVLTKHKFNRFDILTAAASIILAFAFALDRLEVTFSQLLFRILLFGEPTLLTYYAPDPTAACQNLTTFAKMHRGWARALGDPTALNIDTLFGYAWTIQYFGTNTFTGPNARFGAYMACNFPGSSVFIGLAVSLFYLSLIVLSVITAAKRFRMVAMVYPFCVFSLIASGQDFNILMQDINILILFIGLCIFITTKVAPIDRPSKLAAS